METFPQNVKEAHIRQLPQIHHKIETLRSKFPDRVPNIPSVQKPEIKSKMVSLMCDRR